jgi:glycerol-3-phosphate O-acyltransferase/dihydroxyacetone phosphate acyltransferase
MPYLASRYDLEVSRPSPGALPALARFVLRVFFRRVEVVGEERLPAAVGASGRRPLVLVANHVNGLVDPVLVLGALPLRPRFLAKSTLWKIPILAQILTAAHAIPVYRRQDAPSVTAAPPGAAAGAASPADMSRNDETFARCHEALAQGGSIALFPEGTSHNEPALQPLKTGAARIVLEAEARLGPLGTRIVPVGLTFDERGRFRSRALVRVGEPIDPAPEISIYKDDPIAAGRALTARIDQALHRVTLNYTSWDEARLIARAADLFARPGLLLPHGRTLAATFDLHRAFLEGYGEMKARCPEEVAAAAQVVQDYDRLLTAFHLRDDQVAAAYPVSPVARFVGKTLFRLLVYLPVAIVGTILNLLPYQIVRAIAGRSKDGDQKATLKVFPALAIYPFCWLAEALAVGYGWGGKAGILTFLLCLPTGYVAMLFDERRERFVREARAYLVLRTRGRAAAELREKREAVYRGVTGLVEAYQGREGVPGSGSNASL